MEIGSIERKFFSGFGEGPGLFLDIIAPSQ
jgi:hypothetical protein